MSKMKNLADETGLVYDGSDFDNRLFAETIHTNSADYSRKEYEAMEKDIADYEIKGKGFTVYAWNDCSGYDYWNCKQAEDNYIQVTVSVESTKKADPKEIKAAVGKAVGHFQGYSRY